jgi:hypothetical protein
MDSQKQQVLERIKQANNILVTVSANPTVDQLAACVGLTLMLDGLGKHATAVFSGGVPSTIEFLQPEKTLEKNTDSLRDFIISLDKSKADKLRYKVEDKVVKIFITPYRTSIDEKDLEFSQGDFNVELVVALGVHEQQDLDQAITAHGRILHDAVVSSINTTPGNNLGTINWQDIKASSLSEMVTHLAENFDKKVLDNQVATALLTGIVAETDRFSNNKTSPETMKASAMLMAAGANQQLVATKLQEPPPPPEPLPAAPAQQSGDQPAAPSKSNDGTLQIEHQPGEDAHEEEKEKPAEQPPEPPKEEHKEEPKEEPAPEEKKEEEDKGPQIHIDETGQLHQLNPPDVNPSDREFLAGPGPNGQTDSLGLPNSGDEDEKPSGAPPADNSKFVFTPPTLGGTLTANSRPEGLDPTTDPFSAPKTGSPLLSHNHDEHASSKSHDGPMVIEPPKHDEPPKKPDEDDGKSAPDGMSSTTQIPSVTLPEPKINVVPPTAPEPVATSIGLPAVPTIDDAQPAISVDDSKQKDDTSNAPLMSTDLNSARDAVMSAISDNGPSSTAGNPIAALNAQPLGGPLHEITVDENGDAVLPQKQDLGAAPAVGNPNFNEQAPGAGSPSDTPMDMPLPPALTPPPANSTPPTSSDNSNPSAPPPVPPPMMPFPPSSH